MASCWRRRILIILMVTLALMISGFNSIAVSADTAAGKAVYEGNGCSACHGVDGEGGLGPTLATVAFAQKYANRDRLVGIIRQGAGTMPRFTEQQISQGQMDDLVSYIMGFSQVGTSPDGQKGAATGQDAEARYGGLPLVQWYGLIAVSIGAVLPLSALFLRRRHKGRASRHLLGN